jgi:GcrA cell cycle regulator
MPRGIYYRSTYNRIPRHTDWPSDRIIRLRALWDEGHSTAEIGRRLGVSKNAVVAKSHRLDLPGRPSPIKGRWPDSKAPERRQIPKLSGPTLAALTSLAPAKIVVRDPLPPLRSESPKPKPVALFGRVSECCFPEGEPGTPGFHYCDAPTMPGGVYCEEHHRRCHVRQHVREPDAPVPHETPSRFSFQRRAGGE